MWHFFNTTEFFVIMLILAACVLAYAAMPHRRGAVKEVLLGAELIPGEPIGEAPSIEVKCTDKGDVVIVRKGLKGIYGSGAVSAKIEIKGYDITVHERLTSGHPVDGEVSGAWFTLDFLAPERYFLRYESENLSASASLSFRNTPGYHAGPALLKK